MTKTVSAPLKQKKSAAKHAEKLEMGGVTFYSNAGVSHLLKRSVPSLWQYWKEYERRTGHRAPTIREKNAKYIKQDDLYKVILVLEDIFGLQADQIKRERPDLVAQITGEDSPVMVPVEKKETSMSMELSLDSRKFVGDTFEYEGATYYSRSTILDMLRVSSSGLWAHMKTYEQRTGQPVPTVREKKFMYVKQDDLYKFILVLEDKFEVLADQIKRERPDLVAQVAKEVEERKGQHE